MSSAKAFGLFVELTGFRRQGLVHSTAISSDVSFSKDDDEASRAKALDYLCACLLSGSAV